MAALVPVQCPQCGAKVEVDPDMSQTTCRYCGTTSWVERPDVQRPKPPPNTRVIHIPVMPGWEGPPPATPLMPVRPITTGAKPGPIIAVVTVMLVIFVGGAIAFAVFKGSSNPGPSPKANLPPQVAVPVLLPSKVTRNFDRGGRPLIVDVNADSADDAIVWESKAGKGVFLALDGRSGKSLWTSPAYTAPNGHHAFDFAASGVLAVVRGVELKLLDLAKGTELRTITLDDNAARPCRAPTGTLRLLFDSDEVAVIDVQSGQAKLEKKGAPCDEENSDFESRPDDLRRRIFSPSFLPARVEGMKCGGVSVQGSYNYQVEDPCGPRLGVSEEALGFDPRAAAMVGGGALLFGQKNRGRRVAMIARVENKKVAWSAAVSSAAAAAQPEEGADRVALRGNQVALLSSQAASGASPRDVLVVFDIASGKRVREVALPLKGQFVAALEDRWLIVADSAIYTLNDAGQLTTIAE